LHAWAWCARRFGELARRPLAATLVPGNWDWRQLTLACSRYSAAVAYLSTFSWNVPLHSPFCAYTIATTCLLLHGGYSVVYDHACHRTVQHAAMLLRPRSMLRSSRYGLRWLSMLRHTPQWHGAWFIGSLLSRVAAIRHGSMNLALSIAVGIAQSPSRALSPYVLSVPLAVAPRDADGSLECRHLSYAWFYDSRQGPCCLAGSWQHRAVILRSGKRRVSLAPWEDASSRQHRPPHPSTSIPTRGLRT
jgi:hypothetical protein